MERLPIRNHLLNIGVITMTMRGIDIHPYYQRGINWAHVAQSDIQFGWVKVSDGGSRYVGRYSGETWTPDSHAAGMKSIGLLSGGYHYAQFQPSPEEQADVLTNECKRLGLTSLPPALDLEAPFTPNATARTFAERFLQRLKAHGWPKVVIYSYTSMAGAIHPDHWDIPGLGIWIARPGPEGEHRNRHYQGRADVHQYTSTGRVPGIPYQTDLNVTLTNYVEDIVSGEADDAFRRAQGRLVEAGIDKDFYDWGMVDVAGAVYEIRDNLSRLTTAIEQLVGSGVRITGDGAITLRATQSDQ